MQSIGPVSQSVSQSLFRSFQDSSVKCYSHISTPWEATKTVEKKEDEEGDLEKVCLVPHINLIHQTQGVTKQVIVNTK